MNRAGDCHRLPLPAGQGADGVLEAAEVRVEAPHHLPGGVLHGRVVERSEGGQQLAAEEQVGWRVDVVGEGQGLVDRLDLQGLGVSRIRDRDFLAVDQDLAGIGRARAREDPHERGLSGAVAADEADHLPGMEVDGHVAHRMDAAEGDVDIAHLDERRAVRRRHRPCRGWGLLNAHEPRRRFSVSRPTAKISTIPATTFWPGEFTPMKLSP